jgi:predicted amidohydrolase YtcJ
VATLDAAFSIAEAIAFAGDRILRVGSDAEVLALKGPATRLVDLRGRAALPGLIDSHVHPLGACLFELDHEVPAMESIADVLEYVRGRARVVPENGSIWVEQVFITRLKERRYPTRAELDGAAPKHAVVFSTGPDAAVNSLALELSGIDRDFVVQGSGSVEKDPQTGEPTGILRGGAKRHLKGESSSRRAGAAEREERLAALFADYNSTGITAAADRNASPEALDLYARLHRAGRLKVRIAASHALDGGAEIGAALETLKRVAQHPLRRGDARLRIVGVKTFLDGGMLTGSAYMREPWGPSAIYGIRDPEYRGVRFISQEKLVVLARAAAESGLQFTAHAVGDGAVHALLDAYDEVHRALPIAATRPCLTHANFQSAEAIAMMARLGVVADIQPIWLRLDGKTLLEHFGERRLRYFQPLRSLFAAGVVAGGGSDHMQKIGSLRSVNPYNPFLGMWTAITRRPRGLEAPLHAEEALSREQAVRLYTSNNARLLFLEGRIGSLEAGKQADLIVLDRDLLTCPEEAIPETRVLMTFFDGALVHERSP